MRARRGLLLTGLLAPALASCVALLDFDELSAGGGGAAGAGGSSTGGAGQAGEAGEAGSAQGGTPECGDCSDDDPCTVDSCEIVDGEPVCHNDFAPGLALDGVDETVNADDHQRVTMVGGPDAFFYSVFSEDGGEADVALYRLGGEEPESELVGRLSSVTLSGSGRAVSAAGLAVDAAVGLRLHVFAGVANAVGGGARAWHVIFQGDPLELSATPPLPVGDSYNDLVPTNYPVAANIDGTIYGAWITEAQTIELAGVGATNTVFSADTQASTLDLFASNDDQPAVLYTGTGSGVFIESSVGVAPVTECEPAAGLFLSARAVPIGVGGVYFASWTKAGEGFLANESTIAVCTPDGCTAEVQDCTGGDAAVRNSAAVTARIPGDPAGVVHYAVALPFLGPGAEPDSVEAGLSLQLVRIDFGSDPLAGEPESTEIGTAFEVSRMPTDATFQGPDWPAIAYVAPDKIGVAWLQPGDSGDELRVQRYRMCVEE